MADTSKRPERMPAVFLPHGGGPWPFMGEQHMFGRGAYAALTKYLEDLRMVPPARPQAILMISAHWEARVPTLTSGANPPMLYDYYGFPAETYEVKYPAPGHPELAESVREKLEAAGFSTSLDPVRGFDHGMFVPLAVTYPDADMPVLQLSLIEGLDPAEHVRLGRALLPLRDEGVFIVGSGMSYHNLRVLMATLRGRPGPLAGDSLAFDDWLAETVSLEPSQLETRLVEWDKAPKARSCHPREEHLLPLMVVAGAAGDDRGSAPWREKVIGAHVSAVHFG